MNPSKPVDISEFETPPRPPIQFEPLPFGPEKVVLDHDRDSTIISHDESLEMENPWAMEFDEEPTLEFIEKDSVDEHGSFILGILQESCSFNASPESAVCPEHPRGMQPPYGPLLQNFQKDGCRCICLSQTLQIS